MRHCLSFVAIAFSATVAAAQPGQVYDPNAPTAPPPLPPAPAPAPQVYAPPQPQPYPQPYPNEAPPPNATRATFVSTGETRWDIRLDGNAVCTTPCSIFVEPLRFVTLHSQDHAPTKLKVGYLPTGDVQVAAQPRAQGAFAAGVTFTALTGMGVVTGITLTAVGCSTDREGMCNAGLITGVASGVGLYLSINLIRRSLPRVHVGRAQPYVAGNPVGLAGAF
jgi:hypothetical protein